MIRLTFIALMLFSFNAFAEKAIEVNIKLVKVVDKEREFGENEEYKILSTFDSTLEKQIEGDKTVYYLNVPRLGTKYPVAVKEGTRYFRDKNLSGNSTPTLNMKMKGHQLKRLMGGMDSYLENIKKDPELESVYSACFKDHDCKDGLYTDSFSSCYINTQPSISPSSYYPHLDYEFNFARQQGLFFNNARTDSFNFMKNRISFSVYKGDKRENYELHITLKDAAFN